MNSTNLSAWSTNSSFTSLSCTFNYCSIVQHYSVNHTINQEIFNQPVSDLCCSSKTHNLTNTGGDSGTPHLVVLAGRRLLALQTETRGAEELTTGVEVGAVWTLVATVSRHAHLLTADLCRTDCCWHFTGRATDLRYFRVFKSKHSQFVCMQDIRCGRHVSPLQA